MEKNSEPSRTRRARRRTEAQLERQNRVFNLHIEGKTHREIKAELGISLETVVSDIRHEAVRRAEENAEVREEQQAVQLARMDSLYRDAAKRFDVPGSSSLPTAAKVLEMRAKLLGLDAPLKVEGALTVLAESLAEDDDRDRPLTE